MANMKNIADVCKDIFAGGDAPKDGISDVQSEAFPYPIFSNGEANNGLYGYARHARVFEPSVTVSARGTIGFAAVRDEPFTPIVRLITLVPNQNIVDIRYLWYAVQNYHFDGSGTSIPQLTVPMLKQYSFPVPTKDVQSRIVVVLDRISYFISLRKQQIAKLDELVKARFVEMFGDPVADSMKWGQLPLSCFLKDIRYGTSTPPSFTNEGYEFIRATNIKNGSITTSDMKYISSDEARKLEKCKVLGGEMIIVRSGVNAGDTCVVSGQHCGQYAGYDMILVFTEELHPVFTNVLINTKYMEKIVKPLTRRAAQPHLNAEQVQSFPIIRVPYELQDQFAAFVAQTDQQKLTIQHSLAKLELLKKTLMQKYFR